MHWGGGATCQPWRSDTLWPTSPRDSGPKFGRRIQPIPTPHTLLKHSTCEFGAANSRSSWRLISGLSVSMSTRHSDWRFMDMAHLGTLFTLPTQSVITMFLLRTIRIRTEAQPHLLAHRPRTFRLYRYRPLPPCTAASTCPRPSRPGWAVMTPTSSTLLTWVGAASPYGLPFSCLGKCYSCRSTDTSARHSPRSKRLPGQRAGMVYGTLRPPSGMQEEVEARPSWSVYLCRSTEAQPFPVALSLRSPGPGQLVCILFRFMVSTEDTRITNLGTPDSTPTYNNTSPS